MKKTRFALIGILALLTASCVKEENIGQFETGQSATGDKVLVLSKQPPLNAIPGRIIVKFDEEPDASALASYSEIGSFTRMFHHAGVYENRHRKAGLHLWYMVSFDSAVSLTKAGTRVVNLPNVEDIEYDVPVKYMDTKYPFNDPNLKYQWHYGNDGSATGSVAGSDVRVVDAWSIETGNPEVIVAVHDGGIQYDHPDIAQNMWMNKAELNGKVGVDDDGNGFVDDVYGYCFYASSVGSVIHPDNHGTHIAGTIAAVNNNGTGAAGIAGGNGSADSGVRLMSLCTSGPSDSSGGAYLGDAFTYAADNGAVLVNCSWSVSETGTPGWLSQCIDYFNEHAGFDVDGKQVGPMAGGLAIFAAGNENREDREYPAMDANTFAVASIGGDYMKSYYSSYGTWVDITAPGGDAQKNMQIYSTVTGGGYGYMQGTSMAAPHVTGVAALVVSHFGGKGFTREKLLDILKATADPVIYDYNKAYEGKLGAGLIDAYAALNVSEEIPATVKSIETNVRANFIDLDITVPGSSAEDTPFSFDIFYSKSSLASLDPENVPSGVNVISTRRGSAATGEIMRVTLADLELSTDYYVRILSKNVFGQGSALSDELKIRTKANTAPVIEPLDGTAVTVKAFESTVLRFRVADPDGHDISFGIEPVLPGTSVSMEGDVLSLYINALALEDGKTYGTKLYAEDPFDRTTKDLSIKVLANNAPKVNSTPSNHVIQGLKESFSIELADIFEDPDGEELTYSARNTSGTTVATFYVESGKLVVKGSSYGMSDIQVSASDARDATASVTFKVLVRDGSREVEIYPNPVETDLFLRTGEATQASVVITSKSGAVVFKDGSAAIDPFNPYSIDMSGYKSGIYYLKYNDTVYSVIKK